ncbi:MAG: hypothetical protein HQK49_22880, partial [Oligoflexia bacterium]|nr:hypothetical protein [Oligoflexia bacterium]
MITKPFSFSFSSLFLFLSAGFSCLSFFTLLGVGTGVQAGESELPFLVRKEIGYKIEIATDENIITTWQQLQEYISEISSRKNLEEDQKISAINRINFLSRSTNKNTLLFENIIKNEERETEKANTFEGYIKSLNLPIMALHDPSAKTLDPAKYVEKKLQLLAQTFDPAKINTEAFTAYKNLFSKDILFSDYLVEILSSQNQISNILRDKFIETIGSASRKTLDQASDASGMLKLLFSEIIPSTLGKLKISINSNPKLLTEIESITTSSKLLAQIEEKKISVEQVIEHSTSLLSLCPQSPQDKLNECKSIWEKSFTKTLVKVLPLTKSCNQLLEILKSLKNKFLSDEIKKVFASMPAKYFEDMEVSSAEEIRLLKKEITFPAEVRAVLQERELLLYNGWALKKMSDYLKKEIDRSSDKNKDHSLEKELINLIERLNSSDSSSIKNITFSKGRCGSCLGDEEEMIGIECGHKICKDCWKGYLKEKMQAEDYLRCFNHRESLGKCNHVINLAELKSILPKEEYNQYEKPYLQSLLIKVGGYLRNDHNYYRCPTKDCHMHFKEGENQIGSSNFKCPCCEIINCSKCKGAHNDKISCQEYQKQKTLEGTSDSIMRSLMRDPYYYVRPCPTTNCLGSLCKTDACNHVTCAVCKEKKDLMKGNRAHEAASYEVKREEYSPPRIYRVPGDLNMITGEIYTKYTELSDGHSDQIIDEKHPYWAKLTPEQQGEMIKRK